MKYRVIVNGVSFYTTGAAIKRGVGDFVGVNCLEICIMQLVLHLR